ncbi:hypothetical protein B0J12DRAFT_118439 [Macrophomina phaseolina]|uniref:Uncharacterized protein n=1 Tax=Macrophomina phaseolina TaxID=35725 RepID=A0ABQ8G7F5_9PEZI|nr:hypothetical protein B0J12DRAFT_118439 [Macrophomina phaseolina]
MYLSRLLQAGTTLVQTGREGRPSIRGLPPSRDATGTGSRAGDRIETRAVSALWNCPGGPHNCMRSVGPHSGWIRRCRQHVCARSVVTRRGSLRGSKKHTAPRTAQMMICGSGFVFGQGRPTIGRMERAKRPTDQGSTPRGTKGGRPRKDRTNGSGRAASPAALARAYRHPFQLPHAVPAQSPGVSATPAPTTHALAVRPWAWPKQATDQHHMQRGRSNCHKLAVILGRCPCRTLVGRRLQLGKVIHVSTWRRT